MENENRDNNEDPMRRDFTPNQRSADEIIKNDFSPNERKRWAETILESTSSPESNSPTDEPPKDLNRAILERHSREARRNWAEIILSSNDSDEGDEEEEKEKEIPKPISRQKPKREVSSSPKEKAIAVRRAKSDTELHLKPKQIQRKRYRSGIQPDELKHKVSTPEGYIAPDIPIGTKNKSQKYLNKLEEQQLVFGDFICNGSYGFVVEAMYMREKKVAVKIIDKEEANDIDVIESDIRIFSRLKHKHVISLIHSIDEKDVVFLVMPLAESDLFNDIYYNGAVCEFRAKDWFRQIATGLEYIHSNGLAHRDIKLDNILLVGNTLKICDFDLTVKVNQSGKPINSNIVYMHGTLNYMAPELLAKQMPRDLRLADVWSLGITLFAMMTYTYAYGYIDSNIRTSISNMRANRYKYPKECVPSYECQNMQSQLLEFDYISRMSVKQILDHQWFKTDLSQSCDRIKPTKCSHSLNADLNNSYGTFEQSNSDRYESNRHTVIVND